MPDVGSTFNLLTGTSFYPAVDLTVIDPQDWNAVAEDMATAMTARVQRNGQGSMSGDLNLGGNKLTNLAAGSANGHSVRYEQVQLANAFATAWENASWAAGKLGYATGASAVALVDVTAAGLGFLNFTDPNVDAIRFWDDSAGAFANLTLGAGLSISDTTLALSSALTDLVATPLSPTALGRLDGVTANGGALVEAANYAAMRALLDLEAGTDFYSIAAADTLLAAKLPLSAGSSNKLTGDLYVGNGTGTRWIIIDGAASSSNSTIIFNSGGSNRWAIGRGSSDNGENFDFYNYALSANVLSLNNADKDVRINASPTGLATNSAGFRGMPRNAQVTSSITLVLSDAGQYREVTMGSASQTITIPPNSSVAYPLGTVIGIVAMTGGNNFTIVEGSGVTLRRGDGVAATGTRSMLGAGYQTAVLHKIDTNVWQITGAFS